MVTVHVSCELTIRNIQKTKLTKVCDTVPDHHTLEVDRLLVCSLESLVSIQNSGSEDREITALESARDSRD